MQTETGDKMLAEWIAVDWGTSHLRAWVMQGDQPVHALQSDQGMGRLSPAEFEPELLALIDPFLAPEQRTMILCCGMVGIRRKAASMSALKIMGTAKSSSKKEH
ncbi:MAG: 2-dehydro-3-deoxygalactonokinase, partial [Pseudomonadota bacterium]|nr:2-dehydro-3-deoxygalactonokinase [Pseudomonadota bacterium]